MIPVITIDGPSGTGKGTISQLLAKKLGWHYLDSGALYRVLAWAAIQQNISLDNEEQLFALAQQFIVEFIVDDSGVASQIMCGNEDVTAAIRSPEVSQASSIVSTKPLVRQALFAKQQAFRQAPGLVTDGRDMGTVIFPDAPLKIFMTADPHERAQRRYNELKSKGIDVNLPTVLDALSKRDARDEERTTAPLKPAVDAIIIDTTALNIEETFQLVMQKVETVIASVAKQSSR
jgi:CMP/dCMP kinase